MAELGTNQIHHPPGGGARLTPVLFADAEFVASVLVQESVHSPVGDDDKIYYFFMERAAEESASFDKSQVARVARVARVCKVKRHCRSWGTQRGLKAGQSFPGKPGGWWNDGPWAWPLGQEGFHPRKGKHPECW